MGLASLTSWQAGAVISDSAEDGGLGQVPRREASEGWDLMTTEDPPNRGDVPRRAAGFTTRPHVFQVLVRGSWVSRTGRKKIGQMETAKPNQKDPVLIKELLESGKVIPMIDRRYPYVRLLMLSGIWKQNTPKEKSWYSHRIWWIIRLAPVNAFRAGFLHIRLGQVGYFTL